MPANAVLLIACPDRRGIVAGVAEFILRHDGNIVHAEQHVDAIDGTFFQRVEFELDGLSIGRDEISTALEPLRAEFQLDVDIRFTDHRPRTVLLASKQPHCLYDLLTRWRTGEIGADIVAVIANHPDHAEACQQLGIDYVFLPITDGKEAQEQRLLEELRARDTELTILARYMQILSSRVVDAYPNRIINIHHSFLPAFVGANPYRQAHDRGVKLIGATAHYVTDDLDEGPIIEQEVARVTHRDDVASLTRRGRDLETIVLSRAVRAHLEHRVLVYGHKTVVFS